MIIRLSTLSSRGITFIDRFRSTDRTKQNGLGDDIRANQHAIIVQLVGIIRIARICFGCDPGRIHMCQRRPVASERSAKITGWDDDNIFSREEVIKQIITCAICGDLIQHEAGRLTQTICGEQLNGHAGSTYFTGIHRAIIITIQPYPISDRVTTCKTKIKREICSGAGNIRDSTVCFYSS